MAGINHEAVKAHGDKGLHSEWNADHVQTGNHDCQQYQHLNHVLENRTDFPAGPVEGQVIYRIDQHTFYHWNGTRWVSLVGPATVVVAADGSGETTDIQEGIDMLPAGGGVVYVKEGTYTVTSSIVINKSNVSIIGSGKSTIIQLTTNVDVTLEADNKDGILLENFYVYTVGTNISAITLGDCSQCIIRKVWLKTSGSGITLSNTVESTVKDCIALETYGRPYAVSHSVSGTNVNVLIKGNISKNCESFGLTIGHCNNVIASGNIFDGNFDDGIELNEANFCTLKGNICINSGAPAVPVSNGIQLRGDSNNNIIKGNVCYGNKTNGLNILGATEDDNIVVGNQLTGNTGASLVDNGTNTEVAHNKT